MIKRENSFISLSLLYPNERLPVAFLKVNPVAQLCETLLLNGSSSRIWRLSLVSLSPRLGPDFPCRCTSMCSTRDQTCS